MCVSTSLGINPGLKAAARRIVVPARASGPEYGEPVDSVGALPFVVQRMVAPSVAVVRALDGVDEIRLGAPRAGRNLLGMDALLLKALVCPWDEKKISGTRHDRARAGEK